MEEEIQSYVMLAVMVCFTSTLVGAVLTVMIMMLDFMHAYTYRTGVVAGVVKQSILFTVASNSDATPVSGADTFKVIYSVGEEFQTITLSTIDEDTGNYVNHIYNIQDSLAQGYVTSNLDKFLEPLFTDHASDYFSMGYSLDSSTEFIHLKIKEVLNN